MGTTTPTLREALAELDRLEAAADRWAAEEVTKTAELETFEASASTRLIDAPEDADRLTDEAARLRAGLALTRKTREAAEQQLGEARRRVLVARASEMRAEAAGLKAEAAQRQVKTDKLLADLQAWEECAYEPRTDFGHGVSSMGVQERTKTQRMLQQARHLEGKAVELDRFADTQTADQVAAMADQIRGQARQTVAAG